MTMEVSNLLFQVVLDTSGLASRSSTLKRPGSLALATPLPLKPKDPTKPIDTSSQVSIPDDAEMDNPTLEEINGSPSHPVETPGPSSRASFLDVTQLQEEANKALGCLLAMRSTINAHWRKEVSNFGMALHQNEYEMVKAIKAVKALCAQTIRDMEAHCVALIIKAKVWHATCIKEAEADCAHTLAEAENSCSTAIREAESWGTSQAHSIQQSHAKDIQCLEAEAIEEEKRDCLSFLAACGTALRASPPEAHGIMVTPFHLLLGNAPMSVLLSIPQGYPLSTGTCHTDSSCLCHHSTWALTSVQAATQLTQLGRASILIGDHIQSDSCGAPHLKWEEEMLLHEALSRSHQEAFSRDSKLVWKAREEYYWENHLHFCNET